MLYERAQRCKGTLPHIDNFSPKLALIAGSGWGAVASLFKPLFECSYSDISGFPPATVEHHRRRLIGARWGDLDILLFDGRLHLYEGLTASQTAFPVALAACWGCSCLIQTSAVSGLNSPLTCGQIVVASDQINFHGESPLVGENNYRRGPRFPSMHNIYNNSLTESLKEGARLSSIELSEAVYGGIRGPQTATPAESAIYKAQGADILGMSTVCESILAVHAGIVTASLSLITDLPGGSVTPVEVRKVVKQAEKKQLTIIKNTLEILCAKPILSR